MSEQTMGVSQAIDSRRVIPNEALVVGAGVDGAVCVVAGASSSTAPTKVMSGSPFACL